MNGLSYVCHPQAGLDYTLARKIDRYQAQDVMSKVFEDYVDLSGDGKVSDDCCLKGGLGRIGGKAVVVMGTTKGHTPGDMKAANYGALGLRSLEIACLGVMGLRPSRKWRGIGPKLCSRGPDGAVDDTPAVLFVYGTVINAWHFVESPS